MRRLALVAIELLQWVGRWVLRRLGQWGRRKVIHWMEGKIELFGEKMSRHEKAGHMLRADWFEGRIARWTAALRWVRRHFVRLTRRMGRRLYREIENRVEDQVPCETFAKWCMDKPRGR